MLWSVGGPVALAGALLLSYALLKVLPAELAHVAGLEPNQVMAEEGRLRTSLLTLLAGLVAVVGAVYTARTFALNRRGQVTERFTRAVDQLGSDSIDVRLGGIYALWRLAKDSREEYGAVIDVLTAYVREHSPWPPPPEPLQRPSLTRLTLNLRSQRTRGSAPRPARAGLDVQAVMKMLQRRDRHEDQRHDVVVDLSSTNLCGISSERLLLADAHLSASQFFRATLIRADLQRANLIGAQLEGTVLNGADLRQARLQSAVLRNAHLQGANLENARLQRADLRGAGHDSKTRWLGAQYDELTQWPEDLDYLTTGAVAMA